MRSLALLVVCALAVPAFAQQPPILVAPAPAPPSRTLERAIKLYDKKDFYSASIELQKVLDGESGDSDGGRQRAQFFMGKTLYQIGFYVAALAHFDAITKNPAHTYFAAAPKWLVSIVRVAPSATSRGPLVAYANTAVLDDPMNANVREEVLYQLGRELAARPDVPGDQAVAMLAQVSESTSPLAPFALLEIARVKLRMKDMDGGIARAKAAVAREPKLAIEATRAIAGWAHVHGYDARAALAELAPTSAYARYQASRAQLDGARELPGMANVPIEAFDAVMIPAACRANWPDDVKPHARRTLDEALAVIARLVSIADNQELYEQLARIRRQPAQPGGDVVLAALADPITIERIDWLAEIETELGNLQKSDRAWQTTPVAANVLQELSVQQSVEAGTVAAQARERLQLIGEGLAALQKALAAASPAFALSAGPNGKLAIASELCGGGGTMPTAIATTTNRPANGCAGCATGGSGSWLVALALVMLVRRRNRARHVVS